MKSLEASAKFTRLAELSGLASTAFEVPLDTETSGATHLLVCLVASGVEQSGP